MVTSTLQHRRRKLHSEGMRGLKPTQGRVHRVVRTTGVTSAIALAVVLTATAAHAAVPTALRSTPLPCVQTNDRVNDIQIMGATAYIGGRFTQVRSAGGTTYSRAGAAAIDTNTCAVLPWNPAIGGELLAIAATSQAIYLGGDFDSVDNTRRKNLAAVLPTTGQLTSFAPVVKGKVTELATSDTRLYAAGGINSVDGQPRGKAAAFSLATGSLDTGWRPVADRRIDGLAVSADGTRVYLGGLFTTLNGSSTGRLFAAVNPVTGALATGFVPAIRVPVTEIRAVGDRVAVAYAGGGGQLALLTNSGGLVVSGRTDGNVQAVAVYGTEIAGGGHFGNYCTTNRFPCSSADLVSRTKALSLNATTGELTTWDPSFNSVYGVWCMAYDSATGRLFVGGDFTRAGSTGVDHLAVFQP